MRLSCSARHADLCPRGDGINSHIITQFHNVTISRYDVLLVVSPRAGIGQVVGVAR
jgi:hypothetical protein